MKKVLITMLSLLFVVFFMSGCEGLGDIIFENIDIELEDQLVAPVGEYTIPYNYEEINSYIKSLGLILTITVVDQDENNIDVTGNSFIVEEDMIYNVTIVLKNSKGETKTREIIVRTVTSLDLFTITFDTKGGSEVFPLEYNYQAELLMPEVPTKEGYVFEGWYFDSDLTQPFDFTTMPDHNFTLYAQWIEIE